MHRVYTVHNSQKPARPGLAAVCSAASLATVLLVAAGVARLKAARMQISLGERLSPPGWNISFQPPEGWRPLPAETKTPDQHVLRFREAGSARVARELILRRGEARRVEPATHVAAAAVTGWAVTSLGIADPSLRLTMPVAAAFGPLPGAEMELGLPGWTGWARIGLEPDGTPICAMFLSPRAGTPRRSARMLDQIVASVRYLGPPIERADSPDSPFRAPAGTRLCRTVPDAVLPHFTLFPDPGGTASWQARLWETWLIDGRRPADLLRDIARAHLGRAELPAEPSERRFGDSEGLKITAPATRIHEAHHSYWLRSLGGGRVVAAVAGYSSADQSALDEAMRMVLASYPVGGRGPALLAEAASAGHKIVRRLPDELAKLFAAGTTQEWSLLRKGGRAEGFACRSVTPMRGNDPEALLINETYFRSATGFSLKGVYEARLALDGRQYHLRDSWHTSRPGRTDRSSWEESRAGGDTVRRSVSIRGERLRSTFRPGKLFVPHPALEIAAYLVARTGRCAAFTSTSDDLSESSGGLIIQPIKPELLERFDQPDDLHRPQVRYAVRVERDCQPGRSLFWGFDAQGRLVRAHFGGDLSLVASTADEVLSRYPEAGGVPAGSPDRRR